VDDAGQPRALAKLLLDLRADLAPAHPVGGIGEGLAVVDLTPLDVQIGV